MLWKHGTNLVTLTDKTLREKKKRFNLNLLDPLETGILKYKNHSIIDTIRGNILKLNNLVFSFEYE